MEAQLELRANPGKQVVTQVAGKSFSRYAIRTHFVEVGESLPELVKQYVMPLYQPGDFLSMSEKVVSLCQGDVMRAEEMKVSWLAKLLSGFAWKNPQGPAMDNVYKMQAAINLAGPWRIFFAAVIGGICKLFGKKGVFYAIAGNGVRNIDGFCVVGYEYYARMGVLSPKNPDKACQNLKDKLGIECMVVDANDISVEILGTSDGIGYDRATLAKVIKDNPAGQSRQQTPFILIRPTDAA